MLLKCAGLRGPNGRQIEQMHDRSADAVLPRQYDHAIAYCNALLFDCVGETRIVSRGDLHRHGAHWSDSALREPRLGKGQRSGSRSAQPTRSAITRSRSGLHVRIGSSNDQLPQWCVVGRRAGAHFDVAHEPAAAIQKACGILQAGAEEEPDVHV